MGSHVPAIGLSRGEGPLVGPTLVTGRLPTRPDEVALGASVLRLVHRQVGQDLRLSVNGVPRTMHIVGQAVFPAFDQGSFTSTDLGLGAAVTAADLVPPGTSVADSSVFVLVRFAPGPDQAREVRSLSRATASFCSRVDQSTCFVTRQAPFDVGNYARIEGVPQFLALVLAVLGVGVFAQLMIVWVQRRRRDIAVLKTMGFVRRQVLALVTWQAATFAAVSLLIGIPLGIFAGRAAWALFARELGSRRRHRWCRAFASRCVFRPSFSSPSSSRWVQRGSPAACSRPGPCRPNDASIGRSKASLPPARSTPPMQGARLRLVDSR